MSGDTWILMIIICWAVGATGFIISNVLREGGSERGERCSIMIATFVFVWSILACFAPLVYEFAPGGEDDYVIAIKDDGSYTKHPNGCWEWTEGELRTITGSFQASGNFFLDLNDPNSKRRSYVLDLTVANPVLYVRSKCDPSMASGFYSPTGFFKNQFDLLADPVFAQCVDPKDAGQQARFDELAKNWFNPRLQKHGVQVVGARFE